MCGIVGFTGTQQAAPILLSGLSKLEYRGYDSAGIAVRDGDKLAEVVKAKGRLGNLAEKTDEGRALRGTCGIGHTRWATHGEPSQINAHPHVSGNCTRSGSGEVESEVVGVHNGIIENYAELKDKLLKHGYTFYSETDTEVVIKLVDYYYRKYNLGPVDAIAKTMVRVRGSYALELMFRDYPGEIWVARKDSPMIIGITDGETYVASDVPAILKYTRQVYYIGNLEFARLTPGEAHFYNLNGEEIEKQTTQIKWDAEAAEKAGFEHFMMKEIHEQPKAIQDTLNSVIKDGAIDFSGLELTKEEILSPFLRSREFLWQEGHTAHATAEEAEERTIQMLNLYADFCEEVLAIPVIKGQKTDKEKFAGAVATYTIESLMHDGKALQSGTSHNFGEKIAKAFGIQYTDKDNTLKYVHQTSWGMTTRMIGAIIMVHGDNSGLVLPPRIAPTQAVIIPIQQRKEGVLEKADELFAALKAAGIRVKVDDTDRSPGFKFAEQEMRGIPVRIECGPKDIENGQAVICRRDTREKYVVSFEELAAKVQEVLDTMQKDMLERARAHRDAHTYVATNYEEFKDTINNKPGFVKAMWCGNRECEDKIKEDVQATSRCMPFEQEHLSDVCVCCGKPAKKMVYWGRAY